MPASPIDYDDMFLGPDDEPPNRSRRNSQKPVERLLPLPGHFARVPIQWLCKPHRKGGFPAQTRLLLFVLYRSRWGQRGVVVTDKMAAEVGIVPRTKRKLLAQLERAGWFRIERHIRHGAPVVWPSVISG